MVESYLSSENSDVSSENLEVSKNYVRAVETRSRIARPLLLEVIGELEKLVATHRRLKAVLSVDVIEPSTSVPGQIYESINTIFNQTLKAVEQFGAELVDNFVQHYEQNVELVVSDFVSAAKKFLSEFSYLNNTENEELNFTRVQTIVASAETFCAELSPLYYARYSVAERRFSLTLNLDRRCRDAPYCWGLNVPTPLSANETDNITALRDDYASMLHVATEQIRCAPKLSKFLSDTQTWIKTSLGLNGSLPLMPPDRRYILSELEFELHWLGNISSAFAHEPLETTVAAFLSRNDIVRNKLETVNKELIGLFETEIRTAVNFYRELTFQTLMRLMEYVETFTTYSKDRDKYADRLLEEFARQLYVWRKPYPKFKRSETLSYALKDSRQSWSSKQPLLDFVSRNARPLIQTVVAEYFDRLWPRFVDVQQLVRQLTVSAQRDLDALNAKLNDYVSSLAIDDKFVRDNILKIRLFYSDISFNSLEQSPAYDIATLLSDLGGYLGLLIGGSALTIIEVVDLVFYNALLKFWGRSG